MFELNRFLSLRILPLLPFLFCSNLSYVSRYGNHAICVAYNILGVVALLYRIYLLPGLIQPFSTAVWLTRFGFYITCWIFNPNPVPWRFIELLKKRDRFEFSIPHSSPG